MTTGPGVLAGEQPPVEPLLAEQHTAEGASYFAAYFIRAVDWSIATNDPYLLRQVSGAHCSTCNIYINGLDRLRERGGHQYGGRVRIESFRTISGVFTTRADFAVLFVLKESHASLSSPSGHSSEVDTIKSIVFVSWTDVGWRVVEQSAP